MSGSEKNVGRRIAHFEALAAKEMRQAERASERTPDRDEWVIDKLGAKIPQRAMSFAAVRAQFESPPAPAGPARTAPNDPLRLPTSSELAKQLSKGRDTALQGPVVSVLAGELDALRGRIAALTEEVPLQRLDAERATLERKVEREISAFEEIVTRLTDQIETIKPDPVADESDSEEERKKNEERAQRACQRAQEHAGKVARLALDSAAKFRDGFAKAIEDVKADPAYAAVQAHLSLGAALKAKRCGVSFADCEFDRYNDTPLNRARSVENAGQGKVNSVAKLVHADGEERFFKPLTEKDTSTARAPQFMKINKEAPRYGSRNIASGIAAQLLGSSVIPKTCYAVHDGEVGLLMDKAPGQQPVRKNPAKGEQSYDRIKPWTGTLSKRAAAELHEQLNELEWCDLLAGQADRNPFNYFVDVQGDRAKVTGIDNDFACGSNMLEFQSGPGYMKPGYSRLDPGASFAIGLPKLIDKRMLERLKNAQLETFLADLDGLLSPDEMKAMETRFEQVKAHALELESQKLVVTNWEAWRTPPPGRRLTASQFLAAPENKGGSFFERDFKGFFIEDGLLPPDNAPAQQAKTL